MTARTLTAIAFLAVLTVPGTVQARSFSAVDSNRDGVIEYTEAKRKLNNMAQVHFEKCDTNGDGVVDQSEYTCLSGIYDSLYRRRN